ncbi:hypothetical protein [Mesoflavibacter zeaxanthinifaciens]|uniref:hypothetical protein n=1 Tax=Mesoflavibacter zeaxanthinifaciens TaxID=393060 RepID=UPI003A8CF1D5
MNKYYFYTNPTKITTPQLASQAFRSAGTAWGKDKYRFTNLHTATDASAIAVCDDMICIQEDGNGTYSIILKPNYQPSFDFRFIKSLIYKGIKPNSIKKSGTSNEIIENPDADHPDIPFVQIIRDGWQDPHPSRPTDPNPITKSIKVTGLVYEQDTEFIVDGSPKKIYQDTDPIDNLFYYKNEDFL